jgi:hypothetical protein
MMNIQGDQHQQNNRKHEKVQELIHEDSRRTIHELAYAIGISYGVCQEILTENLKTRRTAVKYAPRLDAPAHTSLKTTELVTNNYMVIISQTPYSPHLAPYDFTLFPKLKMKVKG